jgi:hypothetical protein
VKKKKTRQHRNILGMSSFAILEERLMIGISPGATSKTSLVARWQEDELRMVKDTQCASGGSSKDTAVSAARAMVSNTHRQGSPAAI